MRLFAALLPPARVLDGPGRLAEAVAQLRTMEGADRLRWTDRANWHITLAFYGEVPDAALPGLRERLARAARRSRPMGLRIAGSGRFGDRALWAGIADAEEETPGPAEDTSGAADTGRGSGGGRDTGGDGAAAAAGPPQAPPAVALRRLAEAAEAAGRRMGLQKEERRFHAHLTVARAARGPVDLRPYAAALAGYRGEPWTARELALVRSNLPERGVPGEQPRYEQVTAWPLGR
jgi:2'-5' RNA ligase